MAIAQAMCTAFKQELMLGTHNFATNGNAFKLALYAEGSGGKSSTTATLPKSPYTISLSNVCWTCSRVMLFSYFEIL